MIEQAVKILAVDDSEDILFAISAICDLEGWKTKTTADGREAARIVAAEHPSVVLVDYHMPHMDGVEVVRSIRKADPHVPIMVLTIENTRRISDEFMRAGADDFALKPIKPLDLISRIRLHLKNGRAAARNEAHPPVSQAAAKPQEDYVKGINPATCTIVRHFLEKQTDYLTIDEISQGCGLAYQTTYRYLTYLACENIVEIYSAYGRQGRPKQKYRLYSTARSNLTKNSR
jgi:response regulator of citrate/malate metabolism